VAVSIVYISWRAKVRLKNWRAAGHYPHRTDEELLSMVKDTTITHAISMFHYFNRNIR
jgi:hypothetical protein